MSMVELELIAIWWLPILAGTFFWLLFKWTLNEEDENKD